MYLYMYVYMHILYITSLHMYMYMYLQVYLYSTSIKIMVIEYSLVFWLIAVFSGSQSLVCSPWSRAGQQLPASASESNEGPPTELTWCLEGERERGGGEA